MKFLACSLLLLAGGVSGRSGPYQRGLAGDDDAAPEWTYRAQGPEGEEPLGPSDWELGYPDCGGQEQTPINLAANLVEVVKPSEFKLKFTHNTCESSDLTFTSDSAVYKIDFDACEDAPYLEFDGDTHNLLQIHIHSPSEHQIGGAEYEAEVHFVHLREGSDSDLLVVGVMYDVTEYGENLGIEDMWKVLGMGDATTDEMFTVAVYDLLPVSPSYSHYMGSLTTPPCSEGVKWIVMNEPGYMSKRQLDEYRRSVAMFPGSKVSELGNTNRPIQPLNGRDLYYVKP